MHLLINLRRRIRLRVPQANDLPAKKIWIDHQRKKVYRSFLLWLSLTFSTTGVAMQDYPVKPETPQLVEGSNVEGSIIEEKTIFNGI
ncbi:hypothetical protein [Calderihabitans maritimus]|uniref:hypothetical protein n=1 Tax=Calderihabitans maritimus TaxID=1246530 RepID=UPI0011780484|nr:hypothetical protein [Calderihabitans maritimus]